MIDEDAISPKTTACTWSGTSDADLMRLRSVLSDCTDTEVGQDREVNALPSIEEEDEDEAMIDC